ncbi:hypothetical protein C882_1406 [Caenispirillum salinarum AK4]|uniref:Uncharacterized protein n=1 Tax=Caenispirillum salinarum AK4 TaxID=1238182 RepID=K9GNM3_9PROT|nr:hypothetical protein [Caenispirillum salinarum]EKV27560.1 hypothetical protein C882_1406 [Caenispirillum salinarum AK4]
MISHADARAIIDMETREPARAEQARALQLCITHLCRDAAELGLDETYRTLMSAVATIDAELKRID